MGAVEQSVRRLVVLGGLIGFGGVQTLTGGVSVEWAYHAADDVTEGDVRGIEEVPGETFTFIDGTSTQVDKGSGVTLYLLTSNQYAGSDEEQVYLRWWNGFQEHWLDGKWIKNVTLGTNLHATAASFRGMPTAHAETVFLDLWRFKVPQDLVNYGDHYYCFQLKSWSERNGHHEKFLIRRGVTAEFGGTNRLGQVWTGNPAEFFGNDWRLTILPSSTSEFLPVESEE